MLAKSSSGRSKMKKHILGLKGLSDRVGALQFDFEIEKTAKKLRKEARLRKLASSTAVSVTKEQIAPESLYLSSESDSDNEMAQDNHTLRELAVPPVNQQPLCITYPNLEAPFELKSGLIHLLPTFRGLENEDPHKHLKEFHVVCSTMRPQGVTEEQIKLRAFPFSLADAAKDWLFYLPLGTINSWTDMVYIFLDKFFPASRAAGIRRDICGIKQRDSENLHEYWERFKRLCPSCPQHGISDQALIQYFYEGLLPMERRMMDAASGGAIVNKTPQGARDLISTMAANSQQFRFRQEPSRRVNEVSVSFLEDKLNKLTSLVQNLVVGNTQQVKACGICAYTGHPTDMCPTLQTDTPEYANAIENFPGPPQRKYDSYSNTYNPGWRDHPNLSYGSRVQNFQQFQQRPPQQNPPGSGDESKYTKFGESSWSIGNVPKQVRVSRSGKELEPVAGKGRGHGLTPAAKTEVEIQKQKEHPVNFAPTEPKILEIRPPFPERLAKSKKDKEDKEILDTFRKVEINIPLLDAIRNIPRYAKFLKELCTNKKKISEYEKVIALLLHFLISKQVNFAV
ncbi:hypothetical protein K2173_027150 [Erythroxylum novogranatense]|uniref:Retrotransposon gag domain-containing protein n=1 Tax=Erythroxylum novogranatense TaxID=1862640 RepID=A0AAV8TYK0_9ROSI|nr:hypothetical protein K2173_027150 [Erythroxylum novogranatense]